MADKQKPVYKCHKCAQVFTSETRLKQHLARKVPCVAAAVETNVPANAIPANAIPIVAPPAESTACEYCGNTYVKLKTHVTKCKKNPKNAPVKQAENDDIKELAQLELPTRSRDQSRGTESKDHTNSRDNAETAQPHTAQNVDNDSGTQVVKDRRTHRDGMGISTTVESSFLHQRNRPSTVINSFTFNNSYIIKDGVVIEGNNILVFSVDKGIFTPTITYEQHKILARCVSEMVRFNDVPLALFIDIVEHTLFSPNSNDKWVRFVDDSEDIEYLKDDEWVRSDIKAVLTTLLPHIHVKIILPMLNNNTNRRTELDDLLQGL